MKVDLNKAVLKKRIRKANSAAKKDDLVKAKDASSKVTSAESAAKKDLTTAKTEKAMDDSPKGVAPSRWSVIMDTSEPYKWEKSMKENLKKRLEKMKIKDLKGTKK